MSISQEQYRLTKLLTPLIVFIVLIIVITLMVHTRMLDRKAKLAVSAPALEMRLDKSPSLLQIQKPEEEFRQRDKAPRSRLFPVAEEVLATANYECSTGMYAKAEDPLRTALVFYPDHKKILHLLGRTLYSRGKYENAERVFRYLIRKDQNDVLAFNNLATVLAAQKRYPEALRIAEIAYEKDNSSAVTALNLASICSLKGDKTKALSYFRYAYDKLGAGILSFISNHNFDPIRQEKVFRRIVHEAQKKRSQTR